MRTTGHDIRDQLRATMEHFEHVLPGQAPIKDFVHHNTLHGFQHLHFTEALKQAASLTGARGYESPERFREYYAKGRISNEDLNAVLDGDAELAAGELLIDCEPQPIYRRDIYRAALTKSLQPVATCQLNWQMDEMDAPRRCQPDVTRDSRDALMHQARLAGIAGEADAVADLWQSCLDLLGLEHFSLHPEELLEFEPSRAEALLQGAEVESDQVQLNLNREAQQQLKQLLGEVGEHITLRGLLQALTGDDLLDDIRPLLARALAGYLDQGLASWQMPERDQGFYSAWRTVMQDDPGWMLEEMPEFEDHIFSLPEEAIEAIIDELQRLDLPQERWSSYLERLALELPGWSGMFLWRHRKPGYEGFKFPVDMADYLAVRLILERMAAQRICRPLWAIEPSLSTLRGYFRRNLSEFTVRQGLFNSRLPEYLVARGQQLVSTGGNTEAWRQTAQLIWRWRQSPAADHIEGHSVQRSAWPLFRLCQHLGISGNLLRAQEPGIADRLLDCVARLTPEVAGYIWLRAYERHYREQLFRALAANEGRGRWADRSERPSAQVVFCMDDREEGIRRHLEELAPNVETIGAAAHFNVFHYWRGLDDEKPIPLCPVVAVPTHSTCEHPQRDQQHTASVHRQRRSLRLRLRDYFLQDSQQGILGALLPTLLGAPMALVSLLGKSLAPLRYARLAGDLRTRIEGGNITTDLEFTAAEPKPDMQPSNPQMGFTDDEQVTRAEAFLRNISLVSGFAPLTVIMGHGSISLNNPHLAAYDCGACSGRHSGANARVMAAMANRPETRARLRDRGIDIPDDCWFIGAEHNTCDEGIDWYDLDKIPSTRGEAFEQLKSELHAASIRSAHERCRRLASAPDDPSLPEAASHIAGRAVDFSQARPELGHATNAAAFIGRRSATRGAFFDRRLFLISYDANTDPTGEVIERLLLANGPVGAGINLEYYFSTVDNENYGCGSKVTHNVTGLFGVMEGTSSDLRTGLPKQMIEIHEAMRLLVVVEAKTEVLTEIYLRQPPLQELIGNGWLVVAAKDPDCARIDLFDPASGWHEWQGGSELPEVASSTDWYHGHREPLSPALIAIKEGSSHA